MADPHAHVWEADPNTVVLYATHDCNKQGSGDCTVQGKRPGFRMLDWWVWSSNDLRNWTLSENRVTPDMIVYENENTTDECWATVRRSKKERKS